MTLNRVMIYIEFDIILKTLQNNNLVFEYVWAISIESTFQEKKSAFFKISTSQKAINKKLLNYIPIVYLILMLQHLMTCVYPPQMIITS